MIEIARLVVDDLSGSSGRVVYAEGAFWRYGGSHWEPIAENELRRVVHEYDGSPFFTQAGNSGTVKLSRSRINSVLSECAALCSDPSFFERQVVGINCASGLIGFDADGTASIHAHHPPSPQAHAAWALACGRSSRSARDFVALQAAPRCLRG